MKTTFALAAGILGIALLAGCEDTMTETISTDVGNGPEGAARTSCVNAVRRETGNPDVYALSSDFSEAGTEVITKVGGTGTWHCIAYLDGSTADIYSMTNEGSL